MGGLGAWARQVCGTELESGELLELMKGRKIILPQGFSSLYI